MSAALPPNDFDDYVASGFFGLMQVMLVVTAFIPILLGAFFFLLLTGCGSTTDLARDVVAHVSPAASSPSCPAGTVNAAGWCCTSKPVPLCTPTADAFADGLTLPVDNTDAPMVKP